MRPPRAIRPAGAGAAGSPKRAGAAATVLLLLVATGGCIGIVGSGGAGTPPGADSTLPDDDRELLVPPGYGTLRQEELSLSVVKGSLVLRVTPLEEWVIRLAAPDTYDRLSGLARSYGASLASTRSGDDPALFLVSFFSSDQGTVYDPEDVHLVNRGRRYRPLGIEPVSTGWGDTRLVQREPALAVYAYAPELELDMGMRLEYEDVVNDRWSEILQRLQAERSRARARAGGG